MKHTPSPFVNSTIHKIAFGSCADNEDALEILREINDSDVFVFLGDNVYADTDSPTMMRMVYNRLSCKPGFQALTRNVKHILAIWDDHDFGMNDGGKHFVAKRESQTIFSEFFRLDPSRVRDDGVYGSYQFQSVNGNVNIILMDLRFNRDDLNVCSKEEKLFNGVQDINSWFYCPYVTWGNNSPSGMTMLGAKQWRWLELELARSQRENWLTILGSSTQFGTEANGYETWENFPHEKRRLLSLINPLKTVVISGDVHWGEVSVLENGLIDVTSSGISNVDTNIKQNKYRRGLAHPVRNYGVINLDQRSISLLSHGKKVLEHIQF
jgi:alkaline phosphatase D